MWNCENGANSQYPMLPIGNWKLVLATLAILATLTPVFADGPADTQLSLGEVGLPTWMQSYGGNEFVQPTAAYPISAAHAPVEPEDKVTATSTKDTQVT